MGFLEGMGLKVREGISGKRISRVSPMGGNGAYKACDISLVELYGTDKHRNIKNQAKELDIMGKEVGSQNHMETLTQSSLSHYNVSFYSQPRGKAAASWCPISKLSPTTFIMVNHS